jgi:hypothetical protein
VYVIPCFTCREDPAKPQEALQARVTLLEGRVRFLENQLQVEATGGSSGAAAAVAAAGGGGGEWRASPWRPAAMGR